jgi:hypothetical protein
MLSHCPFRDIAVGVATMICESPDATSLCSINVLKNHQWSVEKPKGKETYFVFLQHHEVEVLDSFLRILTHTLHKGRVTDDIADILIDERIPNRYEGFIRFRKNETSHFERSVPVRRPKPFFSVCTISILAYSLR